MSNKQIFLLRMPVFAPSESVEFVHCRQQGSFLLLEVFFLVFWFFETPLSGLAGAIPISCRSFPQPTKSILIPTSINVGLPLLQPLPTYCARGARCPRRITAGKTRRSRAVMLKCLDRPRDPRAAGTLVTTIARFA
jgi:hypothetical protein